MSSGNSAAVLFVLILVTGCAAGIIVRSDGTRISGIAIGAARLEACEPSGVVGVSSGSADGAMVGPCARITGGNMSQAFSALLGGAISAAVTYFSGGGL